MIYVLVRKNSESYASLHDGGEVVRFIFDEVESLPNNIAHYQRILEKEIAASDVHDSIVFNGPAWLIAIAGYMWYANEERLRHNVYQFCKHDYKYKLIQGVIDDF